MEQREAGEVPSQSFANPAEADAERFALHPSVIHWRNWSFEDEKYATTSEL